MLLQTLVKISAVNNLSDARYGAGMGVAMMGFPLDREHPHYLSPAQFQAIAQWVQGVVMVGELTTTDPKVIQQTLEQYALDYLQLDDPVMPTILQSWKVPVLIRLRLQGDESPAALQRRMEAYEPHTKYFLLEAASQNEAALAKLQPTIYHLAQLFPVLQGYHVTPDNLTQLLDSPLTGIALQGGKEIKPGYKGFDELAAVLEGLSVDHP